MLGELRLDGKSILLDVEGWHADDAELAAELDQEFPLVWMSPDLLFPLGYVPLHNAAKHLGAEIITAPVIDPVETGDILF